MVVEAKICKALPVLEGEGQSGHYEIHPYIVEWEEIEGGRPYIQSAKAEFNVKSTLCKKLDEIVGLPQTVKMNVSIEAKEWKDRYFSEVKFYVIDQDYRVQRTY